MKTRTFSIWLLLLMSAATLLLSGWRSDTYYEKPVRGARKVAAAKADPTFPQHTEAFKFTALHGSEFLKNKQTCFTCHGADYKGGLLKSSCLKCHPVLGTFDHFNGDISKTHGAAWMKDRAGCKMCHGAELEGKGEAISCRTCHNYPHSQRWATPSEHGTAFLKIYHHEDTPIGPACDGCHSKASEFQKKYPDYFVTCDRCHVEMPHPGGIDEWARAGKHAEIAQTYEGKCGTCHAKYERLLPNFKQCRLCHGGGSGNAKRWEPIMKMVKTQANAKAPAFDVNRSFASQKKQQQSGKATVEPIVIFWGAE